MYLDFFGLHEKPFSIAPDPRYLYMTEQHREAMAHLMFGISDEGGFILLTGEIGTGKTTICRGLLNQLPDDVDIAFIINPRLSATEMLQSVCDDLGVDYADGASLKVLVDALNHFLLESYARGRNTILIIDEAQNLSDEVLEQLRLLTNLETSEKKLLQLILLGQPELNDKLAQPSLKQLAQRVTARFHLKALSYSEMVEYIAHRLHVAGFRGEIFSRPALKHIYARSGGIPRLVNVICDRAMLGAYTSGELMVEYPLVATACKEVLQVGPDGGHSRWLPEGSARNVGMGLLAALLLAALLYAAMSSGLHERIQQYFMAADEAGFAQVGAVIERGKQA
ncbi:MAG: AAA family ATPase [Gammaproteobacteria bacterium]|nr:AAA family ATPase [Gammaproteobacteria bacterium]MBT8151635.1 AAA family ATPase [Gammaproteobacteria bacterium]NND39926.1 AAA family ATPase [Pseudomonadales bacterium]NNM10673.1 AAA family ATPase [Pseudomonadales bacterium]RZV56185.1 MAG: AAA family ATPase [Pseudomonadales bacterium]